MDSGQDFPEVVLRVGMLRGDLSSVNENSENGYNHCVYLTSAQSLDIFFQYIMQTLGCTTSLVSSYSKEESPGLVEQMDEIFKVCSSGSCEAAAAVMRGYMLMITAYVLFWLFYWLR